MADSRTERLCILLTASSNRHHLTRMYLIQPSLMSPGFPKKKTPPSNSSRPRIVAAQNEQRNKYWSDRRNTVYLSLVENTLSKFIHDLARNKLRMEHPICQYTVIHLTQRYSEN